jgi:HPt (histidine-containing phosphotransfer) domain-containing protein
MDGAVLGVCKPEEAIARLGGYLDIYAETIASFLKDEHEVMAKINDEILRGEQRLVQRSAHTLKGFAAMCGAVGVSEAAAAMERAALQTPEELPRLAQRLEAEFAASRSKLARYSTPTK